MTGVSGLGLMFQDQGSVPPMDPSSMTKQEKKKSGSVIGKGSTVFGTNVMPNLSLNSTILGKAGQ